MNKKLTKKMRNSTIMRNRLIMKIYHEVLTSLGDFKCIVPRTYIYEKVQARTGYCIRKIEDVVNHFRDDQYGCDSIN